MVQIGQVELVVNVLIVMLSVYYFHSWKYTCGSEKLRDWGWVLYLLSENFPLTIAIYYLSSLFCLTSVSQVDTSVVLCKYLIGLK